MAPPHSGRLFYGYVVVAACFVVLFFVWGMVLNTFPIFLKPIAENMGWGRGELAIALVIGLGLLAGSRVTELWQLYLVFIAIGCGLMCASIIPCSLVVSNWFISRRGAALSGAFVGTSAGGMGML